MVQKVNENMNNVLLFIFITVRHSFHSLYSCKPLLSCLDPCIQWTERDGNSVNYLL